MLTSNYKFYMQEVRRGQLVPNTLRDLEADFVGLRYSSATGINTIGKARIYTERYADSDRLRVFVPDEITNDSTTVTLTLYFFGENRQTTYDNFNAYIRHGTHRYWDTARNKYFDFVLEDEVSVSGEKWYAGIPFFQASYKLKNLNGRTFDVE